MPDQPFDRTTFGYLSKPSSDDHNRQASQVARTLSYVLARILGGRASDSSEALGLRDVFHNIGFAVTPKTPPSLGVVVTAGLGWQYLPADVPTNIGTPDLIGVDDLADLKPLVLMTPQEFSTATAPAGPNTRIDIVEVKVERELVDSETRRQLDVSIPGGTLNPHNFYTTLTHLLDGKLGTVNAPADSTEPVSYKVGVAANPGTVPATSPGYIKIAEILVGSAATTIQANQIIDRRRLAAPDGVVRASMRARSQFNGGAPILTMRSVSAPPGVKVAVGAPTPGTRGWVRLYVVAGEPTEVTIWGGTTRFTGTPGAAQAITSILGPTLVSGDYILTVDAGLQTALAAATPATAVAIGQKVIVFDIESRWHAAAGTLDSSNAALEDCEYQADVAIAYH